MSEHPLSSWPPVISEEQLASLTLQATTYALSHGLVYLPVAKEQPPAPTSTIHAPLALFPSPIPRHLFDRARALQRAYNVLYARVATDVAFLDTHMGAVDGVGRADAFTGELWRRWRRVRDEGVAQVCTPRFPSRPRQTSIGLPCSRCNWGFSGPTIWFICRTRIHPHH